MSRRRPCYPAHPLVTLLVPALLGYCAAVRADTMNHDMSTSADHAHHHAMEAQASATTISPLPDDPHAHHRQVMDQIGYTRSYEHYTLPHLQLTTMQGERVSVAQLLDSDQPIALNFIFTSCTTICPIMSATFAQAERWGGLS